MALTLPWLRRNSVDGWLSVSFAADRLDLAHIRRRQDEKPEVLLLESRITGDDASGALAAVRKEQRLSQYRCTTLLSVGEYQMVQVQPPQVPQAELKQALRWQIKEMVTYPIDAATIDVLEIPSDPAAQGRAKQVFAIAADNALLAPRCALFGEAGIRLEAVDIPELAQRNISALFEEPNRGLALLAFDEVGGMLTFTFHGELYAVRQIDVPLAALEQAGGAQLEPLVERIALEVQRSLDNFDRLHGYIPVPRLLVSPLPQVPGLLALLGKDISLPLAELDLADVLDFRAVAELRLHEQQSRYLKVLGAALRD
jgi:MSHA biogenesis protein MshI